MLTVIHLIVGSSIPGHDKGYAITYSWKDSMTRVDKCISTLSLASKLMPPVDPEQAYRSGKQKAENLPASLLLCQVQEWCLPCYICKPATKEEAIRGQGLVLRIFIKIKALTSFLGRFSSCGVSSPFDSYFCSSWVWSGSVLMCFSYEGSGSKLKRNLNSFPSPKLVSY